MPDPDPAVIDLGRLPYADAYARQLAHADQVLAARDAARPVIGRILLVEHDPVVTIGRRPGAARHLLAAPDTLRAAGIDLVDTDRGGDVTYHGPGQLVVYPILDLNRLNLGLHAYMRLLEQAVIDTLAAFGVRGERDASATGVWVRRADGTLHKIAALGVRVRRWVSMHGLALNVHPDLTHFRLIVPCGLHGRPVTSLRDILADRSPSLPSVSDELARRLAALLRLADDHAYAARRRGTHADNPAGTPHAPIR